MDMQDLGLHGLIGGSGSNIKSVQSGEVVILTSDTIKTIPISSIDLTKSIILISVFAQSGNAVKDSIRTYFSDNSNLVLRRELSGGEVKVAYQVIEFNNVKSLQSGEKTGFANVENIPIATVNLSKTIIFHSSTSSTDSTTGSSKYIQVEALLTTPTNLKLTGDTTIGVYKTRWFVIEFI